MLGKIIAGFIIVICSLQCSAQTDSNAIFLASKGTWDYPLENLYNTSGTICSSWNFVNLTFYSGRAEPVRAIMPGTVVANLFIEDTYVTMVQFGDYFIAYSNLQKNVIKKGDTVKKGEFIGLPATGPSLEDKYYVDIYLSDYSGFIDLTKSAWFKKGCETASLPIF